MRPFWTVAALAAALLSACKIEQTPQRYIDNIQTPASEVESSRDELADRLLSMAGALERSDRSAVTSALAPTNDVAMIGLKRATDQGTPGSFVAGLLATVDGAQVDAETPVVSVASDDDVAWFRVEYLLTSADTLRTTLRFSGVFVRIEGEWRLTQGHLSTLDDTDAARDTSATDS